MSKHRTTIILPVELHRRVKAKAALQGKTFSDVLRELLERWVAEDPPEYELPQVVATHEGLGADAHDTSECGMM